MAAPPPSSRIGSENFLRLTRRDLGPARAHLATQQYGLVDVMPEVGNADRVAAILVAVREEPEEIIDVLEAVLLQRGRAPRADVGDGADGIGGEKRHGGILRQRVTNPALFYGM